MYSERASWVPGAVVWRLAMPAPAAPKRVLPDGCVDLIWADGALLVAGPDTVAQLADVLAGACYVGLRLPPGAGPRVLGVPASALRDQRVPLADLWPAAAARRLADRLAAAPEPGAVLEELAGSRLRAAAPTGPSADVIVARMRAGASVADTAAALGVGERRLLRHCLAAFGYGPKTLARILRLGEALTLARAGTPFAAVAAAAGYADQAHLAREVRSLAGVPLGALIR